LELYARPASSRSFRPDVTGRDIHGFSAHMGGAVSSRVLPGQCLWENPVYRGGVEGSRAEAEVAPNHDGALFSLPPGALQRASHAPCMVHTRMDGMRRGPQGWHHPHIRRRRPQRHRLGLREPADAARRHPAADVCGAELGPAGAITTVWDQSDGPEPRRNILAPPSGGPDSGLLIMHDPVADFHVEVARRGEAQEPWRAATSCGSGMCRPGWRRQGRRVDRAR